MVEVTVSDGEESITVVFFNQAWRERQLGLGVQALFFGKVGDYRGRRQMTNPVVDVIVGATGEERDPSRVGRVAAIYPASGKAGITSWEMGGFVDESLRRAGALFDPLSEAQRDSFGPRRSHERLHVAFTSPRTSATRFPPGGASPSMNCCASR